MRQEIEKKESRETREITIQSQSGATINLRCEKDGHAVRYIAEIPKAEMTLRRDYPWCWDKEQGQKILVLGSHGSQRQATTVSAAVESRVNDFIADCKEWQQAEKEKLYQPLVDQLPERTFETTRNDEKARQLLKDAAEIKDVKGPEMDGVNMQQSMRRQALRQEARKHCDHTIEKQHYYGHTGDARLKVERELTCEKCGLSVHDEVSEELSEKAMWR